MANLHSRRIGGNLAYWDGHQKRLIDAIGPDVIKYDSGDFTFSPITAAVPAIKDPIAAMPSAEGRK